jgi:hypothetical protein
VDLFPEGLNLPATQVEPGHSRLQLIDECIVAAALELPQTA